MTVRTRFAPSPTGYMHLGGLRTALYAYLFAKKHGGKFLLRIEDTDLARFVDGATEVIYETLKSCGILWDEGPDIGGPCGPYIQSERKASYAPLALRLIESGHAYRCFCGKDELETQRLQAQQRGETFKYDKRCKHLSGEEVAERLARGEEHVVRFDMPTSGETAFDDLVFGRIVTPNDTLDDIILIKADGMPTYNFANVIDDHLMGISHVMRGMEYLSSTPKYNLIYEAFGWEIPQYIHLTLIMRDQNHKLSKRDGDAYFSDFIEKGYLKEAIVNYLVLLGWNPGTEEEFFTIEELVRAFDASGLSKSPAIFDGQKLRWFNAEYIRRLSPEGFLKEALPWYEKAGVAGMDAEILRRILQPRVEIFSELPEMVDFLTEMPEFTSELYFHKKMKTDAALAKTVLLALEPKLSALTPFGEESLHALLIAHAEEGGLKNGQVMWPLRVALSGKAVTPGGAVEIAALLGKEEALRRLRLSLAAL
ncbi:MAG: glutamate--tRNA ligase [Christensenellaceae bacterium]|jgi:glutamyl-tRNA synthetase|nr:glutamate--tRNA ligase [Christensenellaceae bacterium]